MSCHACRTDCKQNTIATCVLLPVARQLLRWWPGLDVVAVEPNEAMIGGFKKVLPDVPILQGTADQLPFDDGSVDLVCVGQVRPLQPALHFLQ
jgi:hypothetical protein